MENEEKSYPEIAVILGKKDARLKTIITSVNSEIHPTPSTDSYFYLLRSIVSQQLSVKAAAVIWNRFLALFPDQYPHEKEVVALDDETLRGVGLSRQKAGYLRNVAAFSLEHGMSFEKLAELDDAAAITYLTAIKGVGKWTVEMVLMFPMDRPNVFPIDDLGIQTKMIKFYKIEGDKKSIRLQLNEIANKWEPYRSLACKYLWRAE